MFYPVSTNNEYVSAYVAAHAWQACTFGRAVQKTSVLRGHVPGGDVGLLMYVTDLRKQKSNHPYIPRDIYADTHPIHFPDKKQSRPERKKTRRTNYLAFKSRPVGVNIALSVTVAPPPPSIAAIGVPTILLFLPMTTACLPHHAHPVHG